MKILYLIAPAMLCSLNPAWAQTASFDALGYLGIADVSANGTVIVGTDLRSTVNSGWSEAYRWTEAEGLQYLGLLPGGTDSWAYDVSADGTTIVGRANVPDRFGYPGALPAAFRWTSAEEMVRLPIPTTSPTNGYPYSRARAASADGTVIAGLVYPDGRPLPARWTSGVVQTLGVLPGADGGYAAAVSPDGSAVFGWSGGRLVRWTDTMLDLGITPSLDEDGYGRRFFTTHDGSVVAVTAYFSSGVETGRKAVRWAEDENVYVLPHPTDGAPYSGSEARGLSRDGRVVVGSSFRTSDGMSVAWRWTEELGSQPLGSLASAPSTHPSDASADATIIVGDAHVVGEHDYTAFLWTPRDGMRTMKAVLEEDYGLDLTGWSLNTVFDISDDGTVVVGYGTDPDGNRHQAWRAVMGCAGVVGKTASACRCAAAEIAWNNPAGGLFSEPANWLDLDVPGPDSAAVFDLDATYTVGLFEHRTNDALRIERGDVTLDLFVHTHTLTGASGCHPSLSVSPGEGHLVLRNGNLHADGDAHVGGSLSVETAARLTVDADEDGSGGLHVEAAAPEVGTLGVQKGGRVHSGTSVWIGGEAGMEGFALVHGAGSEFVASEVCSVALGGVGALLVEKGAAADCGALDVGMASGSSGEVRVSGEGATLEAGTAFVGFGGAGTLAVRGGGVAVVSSAGLGMAASGQGTIEVDSIGTRLVVTNVFTVGSSGRGDVQITGGARAEVTGRTYVGATAPGAGAVSVAGAGSELLLSEAFVGTSGAGTTGGIGVLGAESGGRIEAAVLTVGPLGVVRGPVLALARIDAAGKRSRMPQASEQGIAAGTLRISEGATLEIDSVALGPGGVLGGTGTFAFDVVNTGTLAPGDSSGAIGMLGLGADYRQEGEGVLEIELGAEGHDTLVVAGAAALGGTLRLLFIEGLIPQTDQSFEIIQSASVIGAFEVVDVPQGYRAEVIYGDRDVAVMLAAGTGTPTEEGERPSPYVLWQNYPNPFNPSTTIAFELSQAGPVRLSVFDVLGREVAVVVEGVHAAGRHEVTFEASDLPSGVYFYRLEAGDQWLTRRMVLTAGAKGRRSGSIG